MRDYTPAITRKTFEENARKWLQVVRYNECGLIINFIGDHFYTIPQMIHDNELLKGVLGKYHKRYIFLYFEFSDQTTIEDISDAFDGVCGRRKIYFPRTASSLEERVDFLVREGYEVSIFFSRVEIPFIDCKEIITRLEQLGRQQRVSLLFFAERNLTNRRFSKQHSMWTLMFQNVLFMPIYGDNDAFEFIAYLEKLWKIAIPEDVKKKIVKTCGGSLWLIRQAIREYRNNASLSIEAIFQEYELLRKARVSYDQLYKEERLVVEKALHGEFIEIEYQSTLSFLKTIKLLQFNDHRVTLGIPFFEKLLTASSSDAFFSLSGEDIFYQDHNLSSFLTRQEKQILQMFLQRKNIIVTRYDLGNLLWGESYSDYALDQIISRVRKKLLKHVGIRNVIKTKKGEGYVFKC